jgi:hypothetical protein
MRSAAKIASADRRFHRERVYPQISQITQIFLGGWLCSVCEDWFVLIVGPKLFTIRGRSRSKAAINCFRPLLDEYLRTDYKDDGVAAPPRCVICGRQNH